ncbi:hypothetical protein Y045_6041 [Burkholderia pseudomallei MSHR2451]|nr:hypothetical protein Y045_6041 [Burkholderia pseudomallei MSHR2451]
MPAPGRARQFRSSAGGARCSPPSTVSVAPVTPGASAR